MKHMDPKQEYFSTIEAAEMLRISRVAVLKRIKTGGLYSKKIGRNYAIAREDLEAALGSKLTARQQEVINTAVKKASKQYRDTFERLAKE